MEQVEVWKVRPLVLDKGHPRHLLLSRWVDPHLEFMEKFRVEIQNVLILCVGGIISVG